jgi:hypothetical protein
MPVYRHGPAEWRPYRIVFSAGGRRHEWLRYAPSGEQAERSAADVVGREYGPAARILSVEPARAAAVTVS